MKVVFMILRWGFKGLGKSFLPKSKRKGVSMKFFIGLRNGLIVFVLIWGLSFSGYLYADKTTTYTTVSDMRIVLTFNIPQNIEGVIYYLPIKARMSGVAITDDGGRKSITVTAEIGEQSTEKMTREEMQSMLGLKTAELETKLSDLCDAFWAEALNE